MVKGIYFVECVEKVNKVNLMVVMNEIKVYDMLFRRGMISHFEDVYM